MQNAEGDTFRIPTDDVDGIDPGTTVRVTVDPQDDGSATDPLQRRHRHPVVTPGPGGAVLRDPAGITNQVTVVRVTPDGTAPDGVTEQQLVDVVDRPVADFWSEQSNGAISVGVTACRRRLGHRRPPAAPTRPRCGTRSPRRVGFIPGPGKHLMLYVSRRRDELLLRPRQVGSSPASGGRLYVRDTIASVIAHELGHNFGLGHSSGRQCDAAVESASCRTAAYRDYYDVMGVSWAQLGSLNAAQAARLGVLPAAQQQALTVQSRRPRSPSRPFAGRTGTRALRLTDADGVDYWLEYRTATGRDAWLGTTANRYRLQAGVLLRRAAGCPTPRCSWTARRRRGGWDRPAGGAARRHGGPVSGGDSRSSSQRGRERRRPRPSRPRPRPRRRPRLPTRPPPLPRCCPAPPAPRAAGRRPAQLLGAGVRGARRLPASPTLASAAESTTSVPFLLLPLAALALAGLGGAGGAREPEVPGALTVARCGVTPAPPREMRRCGSSTRHEELHRAARPSVPPRACPPWSWRPLAILSGLVAPAAARAAGPVTNEFLVVAAVRQGGEHPPRGWDDPTTPLHYGVVHDYWAEQSVGAIEVHATAWPTFVTTTADLR